MNLGQFTTDSILEYLKNKKVLTDLEQKKTVCLCKYRICTYIDIKLLERNIIMKCEFYDVENMDGYFSGTMYLFVDNKRYILDFGYDIEFKNLTLFNCSSLLYNSYKEHYTDDELENIKRYYSDVIFMEIYNYI